MTTHLRRGQQIQPLGLNSLGLDVAEKDVPSQPTTGRAQRTKAGSTRAAVVAQNLVDVPLHAGATLLVHSRTTNPT